ncbi:MAG: hypothetical protein IJU77_11585 [Butyrivibrio sp.]|jgi:hypothetical protein|nr:hypothetical protein [Butyrivibrio sp.]
MSDVPKSQRSETDFEADHHIIRLRHDITEFILLDFGFSKEKNEKEIERFRKMHEYSSNCDEIVSRRRKKAESFDEWFIDLEAEAVLRMLRTIQTEYTIANEIYPSDTPARTMEYCERRKHMNNAITMCYALIAEIKYIGRTLPVDFNRYETITDSIEKEIALLKGIRKADNRFIRPNKKKKK